MKNLTKFLTVFLLALLGANLQPAWAWSVNATVYYDNTKSNWSDNYVSVLVGRGGDNKHSSAKSMTKISNTKLYVNTDVQYTDFGDFLFIGTSGSWGDENSAPSDRWGYATHYSGTYNSDYNGTYLFTSSGSSNGSSISQSKLSSSKSDYSKLNKQQTVKVMVKATGQSSYVETSTFCGTITATRYTLDNASTANKTTKTLGSDNYASGVLTSTISFTESNTTAGFTFKGWGTSSSTISKTDHTYSYTVDGEKTIYVFYEFDINVLQATSTKSDYYLHTWSSDKGKDFYKTQLANFYVIDNGDDPIDFTEKTGFGFKYGPNKTWKGGGGKTIAQGNTWYTGVYADGNGSITNTNMTFVSYIYFYYDGSDASTSAIYLAKGYNGLSATKTPPAGSETNPTISKTYVTQGQSVNVEAKTAATGYRFVNWTSSNGSFGNASNLQTTFTPSANNAVATANYSLINYTITYDPEPPVNFAYTTAPTSKTYGQSVAMEFTPDANYVIASVTAYKTGASSTEVTVTKTDDTHYSFTQPAYDVTVKVEVSLSTVKVTYGEIGNGSIIGKIDGDNIGDSPADVPGGSTVVFTATPDANYTVEGWYDNASCTGTELQKGDNTGNAQTYTIENIAGAKSVYVKFKERDYSITLSNGTGINAIKVDGTAQNNVTAHVATKTGTITADVATGYTWKEWTVSTNNITASPDLATNGIQINATSTGTLTATATPKTYTISFNQNGGEGGQTATVTATYDQAMPGNVTCPTRVGYKFNGYWDATSGGTQYYTAAGASTRTWNKDANTTLYAQWTQMHVYVQGRMHVANQKRSAGGSITWTNSFNGGTQTETNNQWAEACRAIEMQLVTENDRTYYKLVTNATLSDLSTKFSGGDNLWQYFYLRSTSTTSGSTWDGSTYKQVENGNSFKLADRGEEHARAWSTAGEHNPRFSDDDRSGYVVIYFDETKVWYELEEFTTRNITVNHGLGGNVEPSSTIKVGEVSWEVKATAGTGYYFKCWTASDANIHFENATQPTTKITATGTGDGSITANFVATTMIYFQKPGNWTGEDVYVYFYNSDDGYWDKGQSTGGTEKGTGPKNRTTGKKMEYINDNTYRIDYHPDVAHKAVAFANGNQGNNDIFDNTSVSYRTDFNKCSVNNWFIPDNKVTGYYNKHDNNIQTAYYNDGYWTSYTYLPVGYFLMNSRSDWEAIDEYHFQDTEDASVKRLVVNNVNENDEIEFKIWQTCNCWLGVGATDCVIKEDTKNYGINTGNENITLKAWKTGSYEFVLYTKTNSLDVTYLGPITVANFPAEVSTFVNRQHKIKPDVTLRNGTTVNDVTITVTGGGTYATYEQNGTNLIVTGKAIGSETVTVKYANKTGYEVTRTLKVNVADPIIIQAKLKDGDTYWSKTGLVHIHFWGNDAETAQDMTMSYNSDTKLFSVTAPMITKPFKFIFWYGEDINQSASEAWRKTNNIETTQSACYTIDKTTSNTTPRTATPEFGLCSADEYYVEITMKNGNTYKSNTIDELTDTVSFFAPNNSDEDQYKTGSIRIVHNGMVSDPIDGFTTAGVYVAKINSAASGFESKSLYTGKYYIRTDGAAGGWNEYKNADNEFVEFTRRTNKNESYSYYWVKNLAKTDKTNVKGDVANDYNDNLANMVENDRFTDGGGYIYPSANGANVRFSYEPTTNEFKRAIIGGSTDDNFLNIYSKDGGRLFADKDCMKELNANADLPLSKFSDVSDWVYEKVVYAKADGEHATNVILKSVYNGQTTHLLGYNKNDKGEDTDDPKPLEVLGATTNAGTYALRISYDYKRNRLMASWEPGSMEISYSQVIDADVLFIQKEDANGLIDDVNVAQITYTDAGITAKAKLTSLKNIMYILEITPNVITDTQADNQLYWFSLPFNCNINDIFGVEDYVTLDANGQATAGTWGIQRYDGATRASHGWFQDDNPEGFWRWMKRNETLVAGTGYVLVFDKTNASSWKSIGVEEPCKDGEAGCTDGKKTVERQIKRLYFPSISPHFEISYSGESSSVPYTDNPCNVEKRKAADSNWKVIGPVSYNNIGVDNTADKNLTFYYTYNQAGAKGNRYMEQKIDGETNNELKSFHSYMTQFGGTLTWKPFTKSSEVVKAPHYTENPEFQGGMLTIELRNAKGEELNHTFINLSKNGTTGFDQNLDLTKITENCAQIASVSEDVLYAGNTLPLDIEMVPLNVKVVANGTYDIALAQSLEGLEVRLYDAFEQTTTPLDLMSATVTLDKGEYKDRFFLQFVQKSPLTPTNFNGTIEQFNLPTDKTQKLLINDNIYLINAGRIYNVLGARP